MLKLSTNQYIHTHIHIHIRPQELVHCNARRHAIACRPLRGQPPGNKQPVTETCTEGHTYHSGRESSEGGESTIRRFCPLSKNAKKMQKCTKRKMQKEKVCSMKDNAKHVCKVCVRRSTGRNVCMCDKRGPTVCQIQACVHVNH